MSNPECEICMDSMNDPDTITLKRIYSTHCQVCGTEHQKPFAIAYFVGLDNNIVCHKCAYESGLPYEPRIYKEGE